MSLDEVIPIVFLKEFSYTKNLVRQSGVGEAEASDYLVRVGEIAILFEEKERNPDFENDACSEKRWFEKKVLGKAVTQHVRTLAAFEREGGIQLSSKSGDISRVHRDEIRVAKRVVAYRPGANLPHEMRMMKIKDSARIGIVHLFDYSSWSDLLTILLTPRAVHEYLEYRETLCRAYPEQSNAVNERALLGHYLKDDPSRIPSNSDEQLVDQIERVSTDQLLLHRLHDFRSRAIESGSNSENSRRTILAKFALLDLARLRILEDWFRIYSQAALANEGRSPVRLLSKGGDTCFLFLTETSRNFQSRQEFYGAILRLAMYSMKASSGIAVGFCIDKSQPGGLMIDWLSLEYEWQECEETEKFLQANPVFGTAREKLFFQFPHAQN